MISFKEFIAETEPSADEEKVVRLRMKSGKHTDLDAFLDAVYKETEPNPFLNRMRVWKNSIGVEIYKFDGMIHLASIMSFDKKNAGEASLALKWLTDLADQFKVKMDLSVKPIKNAGAREGVNLNKAQLKAWYRRNGFITAGSDHMLRLPK